ncbi:MAG TPA: hypothetical protein PK228_08430 [Saprospiraceae bacterium]|nr:hypothetical protein [Saprospiraceae bacterium]
MRNIFFIVFLLVFKSLPAQVTTTTPVADKSASFPASWQGDWNGTLEIFNGKGKVQSVEMTVEIHKIDTSKEGRYTFGLIYGSKEQDWRPYELVPVAPEKGVWKVDEKNSIAMESYLYGPKLLCWFTVQGSRILCTYEKIADDTMVFEVISGSETAASTTGNTKQGEEEIPEVKTYPFSVFQRALLKRN